MSFEFIEESDKHHVETVAQQPQSYSFLPYLNYTISPPQTYCILAFQKQNDLESNTLVLGQRFIAGYPLVVFVDRTTEQLQIAMGRLAEKEELVSQIMTILLTLITIGLLFALLCYLVRLRN